MKFKFNMSKQYNLIRDLYEEENFKDRSELLEYLNYLMDTNNRYVCVNSHIRNGKSSVTEEPQPRGILKRRWYQDRY